MPAALHLSPFLALSYFPMNSARPPLGDVRVRKALNLIFDREIVTKNVLKLGDTPAYGFVSPGTANLSRRRGDGFPHDAAGVAYEPRAVADAAGGYGPTATSHLPSRPRTTPTTSASPPCFRRWPR